MKAQCLPYAQIPHTTRLFTDYLSHAPQLHPFYPRSPKLQEWALEEAQARPYDAGRRERVTAILERQNRTWGASPKTLSNLARLRAGAAALMTGQQVGLFGGPAFAIYKALTAVKLADQATDAGIDTVPVFWLATNDHDLAEVNHAWLAGPDGVPRLLTASTRGPEDAPVGTIVFGPEIDALVAEAAEILGDSEISRCLRDSYRQGETFGSAYARLFARLFADWGVILLDPMDPQFGSLSEPIYRAAIERAPELDERLLARGRELEAAGYHQQVRVTPKTTLLFAMQEGARVPVHRRTNGDNIDEFLIGEEKIGRKELLARISARPYDFNPNVLLRPIVEDFLLPTLAYTGGAAEVAYFAQVAVVYEALLGHITPVLPRFSATLVDAKDNRLLEKYRLHLTDLFHGQDALQEKLAERVLPGDLHQAFDRATEAIDQSMGAVRKALERLDPTLVEASTGAASKMQYQLDRLRSRAAGAQARHDELVARHAAQLSNALFPNKTLQERETAGLTFLARHGTSLLHELYDLIHTDCHDHQVVTIG